MLKYIVVSNGGWYVEEIKKTNPNYQGVDRFAWPLCDKDIKQIDNLPNHLKGEALKFVNELGDINRDVESVFCDDFIYVQDYEKLCKILQIDVEILVCKIGHRDNDRTALNRTHLEFLGWDYILKDSTYSCIVNEIEVIDKERTLKLNENGLLSGVKEVEKFTQLELEARNLNYCGLEKGEVKRDFKAIRVYKYVL